VITAHDLTGQQMMSTSNWRDCTVADVAAPIKNALVGGPFGSNLVSRDYTPYGVPVIRGENMGYGRWVDGEFVYVSPEKAGALSPNTARPGDLIFTQRGTLGQVAIVPAHRFDRYIISQSQMKLTADPTQADVLFLYYFFSSPQQQDYIVRNAIQTGVPHTNLEHLRTTPLRLPPLDEQRAIAHILGTLDDKIELNRRMNETLEAMARAIFKSWFVDFDPVRARAEGRQPAGMDAETAALFPDAFEDSPLGTIPKGWRVSALPEMIEVNPRRSLPKGQIAPYLDMQNMPTRGHRPADWISRPLGSGVKFTNGDTLLARITPCLENGKTAFVDFLDDGQVGWGSTEYIVLRPKSPLPPEFGYYLARSEDLRMYAIQNMTGSSGRQRVPVACLDSYRIVVPSESVARRFGDLAGSWMAHIRHKDEESRTLAAIRDALLPKLLSGGIRVSTDD
jgi:type I restriction enzyme S subunit